jgi:hypothetical protein
MLIGLTSHRSSHFLQNQIPAVQCHQLPLILTRFRLRTRQVQVCELSYFHFEYKEENPRQKSVVRAIVQLKCDGTEMKS